MGDDKHNGETTATVADRFFFFYFVIQMKICEMNVPLVSTYLLGEGCVSQIKTIQSLSLTVYQRLSDNTPMFAYKKPPPLLGEST